MGGQLPAGDGGEVGRLAQCEVDLEHDALAPHRLHPQPETPIQMLRFDEAQQTALRVGIGQHDSGVQHFPVHQLHPRGPLLLDDYTCHFRIRPHLRPVAACAGSQGGRQRSHAPRHGAYGYSQLGPIVEHHVDAARRVRPARQAHHTIRYHVRPLPPPSQIGRPGSPSSDWSALPGRNTHPQGPQTACISPRCSWAA